MYSYLLVCITLPVQESITSNLRSCPSGTSQDERSSSYHGNRPSSSSQNDVPLSSQDVGSSFSQDSGRSSFQGESCPSFQDKYFLSSKDKVGPEMLAIASYIVFHCTYCYRIFLMPPLPLLRISTTATTLCTPTTTLLVCLYTCVCYIDLLYICMHKLPGQHQKIDQMASVTQCPVSS